MSPIARGSYRAKTLRESPLRYRARKRGPEPRFRVVEHSVCTPSLSLPKGRGAIRGIGEKLSINATKGTATFHRVAVLAETSNSQKTRARDQLSQKGDLSCSIASRL